MTSDQFCFDWDRTQAALSKMFPQYQFPALTPDPDRFDIAFDGLAASCDLTPAELREQLADEILVGLAGNTARKAA